MNEIKKLLEHYGVEVEEWENCICIRNTYGNDYTYFFTASFGEIGQLWSNNDGDHFMVYTLEDTLQDIVHYYNSEDCNFYCDKCGSKVEWSDIPGYLCVCPQCDENLFSFEVHKREVFETHEVKGVN